MLYHPTYTAAISTALDSAEELGYSYDENEYFDTVAVGTSRPKVGETSRFSLRLRHNSMKASDADVYLHVQVYGMESGVYELNFYIL
jgi:hypothetical protein